MKLNNLTQLQLDDNKLYVTSESFHFELDDEKQRQFGVVFEMTDMHAATGGEEFKDYPFLVQIGIIADKPHKSFDAETERGYSGIKLSKASLLSDCYGYMGAISVDHILVNGTKSNAEKGENGFDAIAQNFSIQEATVKTYKSLYEKDEKYLSFKTEEAAQKFINLVILHRLAVLGLISFILDKPVNRAGTTGWTQIETMVRGCNHNRKKQKGASMSEFKHDPKHKSGTDTDNCGACALENPVDIDGKIGINYSGWPLSYLQSGRSIPKEFMGYLLDELNSSNLAYAKNLETQLIAHGYNIEKIMNPREPEELSEEQLQKIDCEENNLHNFEGEQTCNGCGVSYAEAHADDYDEGDR